MESNRYDTVLSAFYRRYRAKKLTNMVLSGLIVLLGVSSFLYGLRLEPSVTIFRFMTVDGTVFTTVGSLIYIAVNLVEVRRQTELTSRMVYYIRLSSATAETVIFVVVLFSQIPLFDEHLPVVDRYDSFVMHVLIPLLGVTSFLANDSPIGKLRAGQRWHGTWFVTLYAVVIFLLLGRKILPHDLIPYFFLDVGNNPWTMTAAAFLFIYGAGYLMSWALSEGNRKLSWLWFRGIANKN